MILSVHFCFRSPLVTKQAMVRTDFEVFFHDFFVELIELPSHSFLFLENKRGSLEPVTTFPDPSLLTRENQNSHGPVYVKTQRSEAKSSNSPLEQM